jgi:hypothetical protein
MHKKVLQTILLTQEQIQFYQGDALMQLRLKNFLGVKNNNQVHA